MPDPSSEPVRGLLPVLFHPKAAKLEENSCKRRLMNKRELVDLLPKIELKPSVKVK